jgi:hypothetical protein
MRRLVDIFEMQPDQLTIYLPKTETPGVTESPKH